ncbi:4-hydroxybenzoate polyprenyltransferase [Acinetobacter sp. ANC 4558]|uniref:4-hydroxybenzoate octaprenyltransferase n=1 Tax=Acinetobacter sp. ANC 4558 TaxID=1977876 RepID=UPI000A343507|nr:4-hydroxybenzoate octaprenyltransferase [Acinetobacter sp. ANC 4558]OTG86233.1 4-hydroxybenzoate polyprenyltransferase [Acinetobacter sp. ANC 4558]
MATAYQITWRQRLKAYIYLCRFDKPIGTELVFWPTMSALWIAAGGIPDLTILLAIIFGTIFMRAAGCAINDFADRKVDAHVERTKNRPLATGIISAKEAIWVFIGLVAASACTLFFLPIATFYCALIGLVLAFIYPFMKRYTHLPQVVLGMAFSWGIPMSFTAMGKPLDWTCWLLYLGNLAWTVAYDTQYAITDREYDLKIGVKSTAILFGQYDIPIISLLQAASVLLIGTAFYLQEMLIPFGIIALILVIADFIYQWTKTKDRDPQWCFWAFRHNRWIGIILFVGIFIQLY